MATVINTLNDYQKFTQRLAAYNTGVYLFVEGPQIDVQMPWTYPAHALAEEAGEVVGKIAKFVRKSNSWPTAIDVYAAESKLAEDVGKELGDVLYQLSETARHFGFSLQDIADMNVAKLEDRVERGVLIGEGDNR